MRGPTGCSCSNRVHQRPVASTKVVGDNRRGSRTGDPLGCRDCRCQDRARGCCACHCGDALKSRPVNRICRSGGTRRHKQSRCRSSIDLRNSLGAGGQQTTRNHRGTGEAYAPNDIRRSCRTGCHLWEVECLVVGSPRRCGHLCPRRLWHHRETPVSSPRHRTTYQTSRS